MQDVAKYYNVGNIWNDYIQGKSFENPAWHYFMLLKIVKFFSNNDNLWISFVEGLHRHAAILMCLTCSEFDYEDNNLVHDSLRNRHFKLAGVPHYKESNSSPIQILNSIIKKACDAPMLMNLIQVQILHPKNNQVDIGLSMKTLKHMSNWISTNKKLSAEPTISKRLAEDLSQILTLSKPDERRKLRPKFFEYFEYQTNVDLKKFQKKCTADTERCAAGYPKLLNSDEYVKYIKDPFNNKKTMTFLNKESPREIWTGHRAGGRHHPPFGITFESLTSDVGTFDHKT
jgi:hypothetical protein